MTRSGAIDTLTLKGALWHPQLFRETPKKHPFQGEHNGPPSLHKPGHHHSLPRRLPSATQQGGNAIMGNYRIKAEAGRKGQCGTDAPAPHQPGLAHGEQPSLARLGKSRKIDFCFSTVCRVFIDQAAAGVFIRVTQRELDQELLQAQAGAFLGWANLPCLRC